MPIKVRWLWWKRLLLISPKPEIHLWIQQVGEETVCKVSSGFYIHVAGAHLHVCKLMHSHAHTQLNINKLNFISRYIFMLLLINIVCNELIPGWIHLLALKIRYFLGVSPGTLMEQTWSRTSVVWKWVWKF